MKHPYYYKSLMPKHLPLYLSYFPRPKGQRDYNFLVFIQALILNCRKFADKQQLTTILTVAIRAYAQTGNLHETMNLVAEIMCLCIKVYSITQKVKAGEVALRLTPKEIKGSSKNPKIKLGFLCLKEEIQMSPSGLKQRIQRGDFYTLSEKETNEHSGQLDYGPILESLRLEREEVDQKKEEVPHRTSLEEYEAAQRRVQFGGASGPWDAVSSAASTMIF